MPTYGQLTRALDEAWRAHDYGFALSCISELLQRYRGSSGRLGLAIQLVSSSKYSDLAAALDADYVLKAMDRVARRIAARSGPGCDQVHPEELAQYRVETLAAMRWMRNVVENAGEIELKVLTNLAAQERITRVKSRLNWMVKADVVHFIDDVVHWGAGPVPSFLPMGSHIGEVPKLEPYTTAEWEMNAIQLEFFRQFEARHRAGECVELAGQWSYAFTLLYKLEEEHKDSPGALRAIHARFEEDYPDSPLPYYFAEEGPDLFKIGDWQGGYDQLTPYLPMDIYLTLAPVVADTHLQAATVNFWATQGRTVTAAFREHEAEVQQVLQNLLDAAHDELGRSFVEDLWQRLIVDRKPGERGPEIAHEFGGHITQDELNDYLEHHDRARYAAEAPRLELPGSPELIDWPAPYCHTYWFGQMVRARIQALYRDAENILRRAAGVPAVGEGWISEVLLLRSVREAFPHERIVHQGRPAWLGQQSLDIYFPDRNVGIEYQGAQHSGPVTRFGGELAYARQLERDARKRRLCLTNGCRLIEVHPGYDLDSVLQEIKAAIGG